MESREDILVTWGDIVLWFLASTALGLLAGLAIGSGVRPPDAKTDVLDGPAGRLAVFRPILSAPWVPGRDAPARKPAGG